MSVLIESPITITVNGDILKVTKIFLQVFLAGERLTKKELDVAASLVSRYAMFVKDGVKEPYLSILLFSTEVRKEMSEEIGISASHLQNTLSTLQGKNVIAEDKLELNPHIIPTEKLIFSFTINGK
jgi:hypothetical protein